MINKFSKLGFLILSLNVLFGSSSNAQTPVCNLQFDIFELSGGESVKDVRAVLTDSATGKTIKSSAKSLLFPEINSGKYKIEATKESYQRRVKEIEIKCQTADEILTISKVLYLQKGDAKKITEFDSTTYGVQGMHQQYKATNESVLNGGALILAKPSYPAAARGSGDGRG